MILYPASCFDYVLHIQVMMLLFHQQVRVEWLIPLDCETQTGCLGSYWIPANPWHHPPPTGPWISSSRPTWANVSPHFIFISLEKTRHTTLEVTSFSADSWVLFCFFFPPPPFPTARGHGAVLHHCLLIQEHGYSRFSSFNSLTNSDQQLDWNK